MRNVAKAGPASPNVRERRSGRVCSYLCSCNHFTCKKHLQVKCTIYSWAVACENTWLPFRCDYSGSRNLLAASRAYGESNQREP